MTVSTFSFQDFHLPTSLLRALEAMAFSTPTPIQEQAIPPALQGHDLLGSAQTGTGKTAAFGIPLVAHILKNPSCKALVMTPTRELAVQVMQALHQLLGRGSGVPTALLIGGESMPKQFQQLRNNPRVIVGTPGRINDHLMRKSLQLTQADFLVLDETDRMLDMGFSVQIDRILQHMPAQRQTLLFSATMPKAIERLASSYLKNPVRIAVGSISTPAAKIKQDVLHVTESEKFDKLIEQLDTRAGSIIVFVKTKWNADKMAKKLRTERFEAEAIHGDLRQNQRDRVIAAFRQQRYRILVATDIAARGLDIPHIEHVINYDLPQCPEDYIHRIGRTARAGAEGEALCFLTPADRRQWRAIQKLIDPNFKDEQPQRKAGRGSGDGGKAFDGKKANKRPFRFKSKKKHPGAKQAA